MDETRRRMVMLVADTRAQAIKLAPLYLALARHSWLQPALVTTNRQRDLLDQALDAFDIQSDHEVALAHRSEVPAEQTAAALHAFNRLLADKQPAMVIVQGNSTTTLAAMLAAHYRNIPVAQIDAAARRNGARPLPQNGDRVLAGRLASLHFAATFEARSNLISEGTVPDRIEMTGSTAVDALSYSLRRRCQPRAELPPLIAGDGPMMLLALRRADGSSTALKGACAAIARLLERFPDLRIVCPGQRNALARGPIELLAGHARVHLTPPLRHDAFVQVMRAASFILTDSDGVQEEAPALRRPLLVLGEATDRPETVSVGAARLVGVHSERIFAEMARLLTDRESRQAMTNAGSPYGDGNAAVRLISRIESLFLTGQARAAA